jgi:hypothetical protein
MLMLLSGVAMRIVVSLVSGRMDAAAVGAEQAHTASMPLLYRVMVKRAPRGQGELILRSQKTTTDYQDVLACKVTLPKQQ